MLGEVVVTATFGATVFCIIGTDNIVLQLLLLSFTITVHVPGNVVIVDVFPLYGPTAKVPPKPGGRKVKLQVEAGD